MAVNKVVYGSVSIIDISDSTVTPETLGKGQTAYDKAGEKITGTMETTVNTGEDVTNEVNAYTAKLSEIGSAITELEQAIEGKAGNSGSSGSGFAMTDISVRYDDLDTHIIYIVAAKAETYPGLDKTDQLIVSCSDIEEGQNSFGSSDVIIGQSVVFFATTDAQPSVTNGTVKDISSQITTGIFAGYYKVKIEVTG